MKERHSRNVLFFLSQQEQTILASFFERMSRCTDVADEPLTSTLPPIEGYEDLPLVTLEEAIKPVAHLFNGIDSCAWIAKENSLDPADGLIQDESASIYLYTMQCSTGPSLYQVLNQHLRADNREMLKPWLSFLKLFLTALHKLPSHSITVWRVVSDRSLSESYPVGRQMIWWGVSSCMLMQRFPQNREMVGDQSVKTLFSIESRNAKLITAHSCDKDSGEEFVLLPGTCLKVINQVPVHEPWQGQLISLREIAVVSTSRALGTCRLKPSNPISFLSSTLFHCSCLGQCQDRPGGRP